MCSKVIFTFKIVHIFIKKNSNVQLLKMLKQVIDSFLQNEAISVATEIAESPEAIEEMYGLARAISQDGCSVVARVISTGQVVGVVFNLIHVCKMTFFYNNFM